MSDREKTSEEKTTHDEYVLEKYKGAIKYYWKTSANNKRWYKTTRSLTVILGALVTLVASLTSADFIKDRAFWGLLFAIAAPVLAAVLTIVSGFSQAFHWGAAWRDMVLNAQRLERERDRFYVSEPGKRDREKELAILHNLVIAETQGFFQRILGGAKRDMLPKPGHTERWVDPRAGSGPKEGQPERD
jgi:hypothetical protein